MLLRIAEIVGSAKAAWMSAARSAGVESIRRVVGYSTGTSPNSSRTRASPRSNGAGKISGRPDDGERTATRSPRCGFAG
jgi:hypothetical protein